MSTTITAADINKLRQMTGAGMMDCRKALTETEGDFEAAIDWLRKKGQKVAALRGDREAKEGVVLARTTADHKTGIALCLSCETDFVSKNAEFVAFAQSIIDAGIAHNVKSAEELNGGLGNDLINGGDGADIINGNAGDDALDGGAGDDSLIGDLGADLISGGDGIDTLDGGDGDAIARGCTISYIDVTQPATQIGRASCRERV